MVFELDKSSLIHVVESEKEKFLFHKGEGFACDSLPVGSRVIYGPPPLPPVPHPREAIRQALLHPLGCEPLPDLLKPGMKISIAIDDLSLPLPPMLTPDIRQLILEEVLEVLGGGGVTDIHLIMAVALHRHMTPKEIRRTVGANVFNRFFPDRLYNHDAEDWDNITELGRTDEGEIVDINSRAAESDLIIYVNICLTAMDGGHKSLHTGMATYKSIRSHHTPMVLEESSLMDPLGGSPFHDSLRRMGKILHEHLNVFTVETTVNSNTFPTFQNGLHFGFLKKAERDYSAFDRVNFAVQRESLRLMPMALRRAIFQSIRAPYGLTSVYAGRTEPVHQEILTNIYRQQEVPVKGQCDVEIIGVPYIGPYNVYSIMNPLLLHCLALGYLYNMYRRKPLVKEGGVMILFHHLREEFHPVHHPSYIDFYNQVLTETTDFVEIHEKYEEEFATNPRYIQLYRKQYAYHGVHAPYMWYWGCRGMQHLGKVIVVSPDSTRAAERIGYDHAANLREAIEMSTSFLGRTPSISYFHLPPIFVCSVED